MGRLHRGCGDGFVETSSASLSKFENVIEWWLEKETDKKHKSFYLSNVDQGQ